MKRASTICGIALLLTGTLISSGCHAPALSMMKSSKEKVAVGIVGSKELAGTKEILDYTGKILNESAVVFDIRTVEDGIKAQEALSTLASKKNIDLIITEAKYSQYVSGLAKTYDEKKFGLVGIAPNPDTRSVRLVDINREHQSFVAGFLLASIAPKEPIGVIVKTPRSSESPEWKGLLEGIHYAGSSVSPAVVILEEVIGPEGLIRIKSTPPRVYVLLDPVTEDQMERLNESGKWLFSMHDLPKMYPRVIARPKPIFTEGVQEEVQSLLNYSWQGKLSISVMGSSFFDILRPETFSAEIMNHKNRVEDGLRNRTIQPENDIKPPKEEKKEAKTN